MFTLSAPLMTLVLCYSCPQMIYEEYDDEEVYDSSFASEWIVLHIMFVPVMTSVCHR